MSKLHSLLAFNIDEIHQTYSICGINIIDLTIDTDEIGDSPLLQALNPRIHFVVERSHLVSAPLSKSEMIAPKSLSRGVWILKASTRLRVWQARQVMSLGIWHSCLYRFDTWSL